MPLKRSTFEIQVLHMNQNHCVRACVDNILSKLILHNKYPAADMSCGVLTSLNVLDVETSERNRVGLLTILSSSSRKPLNASSDWHIYS